MLYITDQIILNDWELHYQFVRSGGPGGQNVNKVATAVQLRYNVNTSPVLSREVKDRLRGILGQRMNQEGEVVIHANRFRSQDQNRRDAEERLIHFIRRALVPPKKRKKTKPTKASIGRRLEKKRRHSDLKKLRRRVQYEAD